MKLALNVPLVLLFAQAREVLSQLNVKLKNTKLGLFRNTCNLLQSTCGRNGILLCSLFSMCTVSHFSRGGGE